MRGRPQGVRNEPLDLRFQSTPPCGGDKHRRTTSLILSISIHAPLRGRPFCQPIYETWLMISIHAPLRGRRSATVQFAKSRHFNPRPLAGATRISPPSRPPPGFQSTPPCGGDGGIKPVNQLVLEFQSTPPCGGDRLSGRAVRRPGISIHAPLRGRRNHENQ